MWMTLYRLNDVMIVLHIMSLKKMERGMLVLVSTEANFLNSLSQKLGMRHWPALHHDIGRCPFGSLLSVSEGGHKVAL